MGFAKVSANSSQPFQHEVTLVDGKGLVLCDADYVNGQDASSIWTHVAPGARGTVADDNANVMATVTVRADQEVTVSRNQLDAQGLGDDANAVTLVADQPETFTNVSKLAIYNGSGNQAVVSVVARLARESARADSKHPGGLEETPKPLTVDRTTITLDSTYVTIDQSVYR